MEKPDIRIQKKKPPSLWPWLAGLIAIAIAVWIVATLLDRAEAARADAPPVQEVAPMVARPPARDSG